MDGWMDGGTEERRDGGTKGGRDGGTEGRRDGGMEGEDRAVPLPDQSRSADPLSCIHTSRTHA